MTHRLSPKNVLSIYTIASLALFSQISMADEALSRHTAPQLVELLVSPFPPPRIEPPPRSALAFPFDHPYFRRESSEIAHPQVIDASAELVSRGPSVVPELIQHLADERYSSTPQAGPEPYTVGNRVFDIAATILRPDVPSDTDLTFARGAKCFADYLSAIGVDEYWSWSKRTTEDERELAFLTWYLTELKNANLRIESDKRIDQLLQKVRERVQHLVAAGVLKKPPPFRERDL